VGVELPANVGVWLCLAALPLVLTACTAFTKVAIVLAALKLGLGADRLLPPGSILALALTITALVMAPVAEACVLALARVGGYEAVAADPLELGTAVLGPLWDWLAAHADPREIELFAELAGRDGDDPLVLAPAFLLSELGRGLGLAVMILTPFVVVDLICAQVLVLLGLANTPTGTIALPSKILLFLAADGWSTVIVGLVEGYR
jgi:flagellar biosynthesis protein FliP